MANDFLVSLGLANVAAVAAVLAVLALRVPARRLFGSGIAYALWLIVPGAMLATLLPARTILIQASSGPVEPTPAILQRALDAPFAPVPMHLAAAAPEAVLNAPQVLLAVWLAGLVASLCLLVIGQRRAFARFGRITADAQGSEIARASNPAAGPALIGVIRPRLVVPSDFEKRFDADEQAMILTHERTHLASGHAVINALVALLKAVNWFNPLIHLGARYARVDQELACDAAVVTRFPQQRATYAQALLKTQLASVSIPLGCSWPARSPGRLEERLNMLALETPGRVRLVAGMAVVAALIAGGGLTASAAKPPVTRVDLAPAGAQADTVPPATSNRNALGPTRHASPEKGGIALAEPSVGFSDRLISNGTGLPVSPTAPGPDAEQEPQQIEDKTAPAPPDAAAPRSDSSPAGSSMPVGQVIESAIRVRLLDGTAVSAGPDLIYDGELQTQSLTLGSGKVIESVASYAVREDGVIAVAIVIKIDGVLAASSTVKTMSWRVVEIALPDVGVISFGPRIRAMSEAEARHFASLK